MAEALRRGQSRSWYLDELDWIKADNFDDDSGVADGADACGVAPDAETTSQKTQQQRPFVRAPNDPSLQNAPCPICQEKFASTWSEETQDWIWQDAVQVGNRIYHVTCYKEVSGDGTGGTGKEGGTVLSSRPKSERPDSALKKRKAVKEEDEQPASTKIKTES
ncbi:hypothetical protein KEM52_000284 [Ascosphaera acerosa]|nr:hypothetical protein KEM52_000284 [Ascosphaera acerosa]